MSPHCKQRNCSLYGAVRVTKVFTKLRSCVSCTHPPATHHSPPPSTHLPVRSRLRTCLRSDRAASGSPPPPPPVWLKPLSFLSRSIFKPFIFVDDVKLVPKVQSPCFGDEDPARKEPRFQEKPDRRHELYKAHEWARAVIASDQVSLGAGRGGGRGQAPHSLLSGRSPPEVRAPKALPRLWVLGSPPSLLKATEGNKVFTFDVILEPSGPSIPFHS